MRAFTITSTLCHANLLRTDYDLLDNQLYLLKENLGLDIKSKSDAEHDKSWQHKTPAELRQLSNDQLNVIFKSYGRPFSNKNKEKLVKTVLQGPMIGQSITEVEKILKYSFLQPLSQEDCSTHNLDP